MLAESDPQWWNRQAVKVQGASSVDFAALNAGQLKSLALAAKREMDQQLAAFGGAGPEVTAMIHKWPPLSPPSATAERDRIWDYQAVNLGQLKAVAKPFYDRLIKLGVQDRYPWTSAAHDDVDFAVANLGQAKTVFALDLDDIGGLFSTSANGKDNWLSNFDPTQSGASPVGFDHADFFSIPYSVFENTSPFPETHGLD